MSQKTCLKQQPRYYWECPRCHSRYFSEPTTLGVRNGQFIRIHPICTKCFETCQGCGEEFGYGDTHICGAKRTRINLIKHALDPDDPTFGLTSTGSTSYPSTNYGYTSQRSTAGGGAQGYLYADSGSKFTLSNPVTTSTIKFYAAGSVAHWRLAIYQDSSGVPGSLVVESGDYTPSVGLNTVSISATYLASGTYWIAWQVSTGDAAYYWDNGGTVYYRSWTYGAFPNSFSYSSSTSYVYGGFYIVGVQIKGYIKATKATLSETASVVNSMSIYCHVNTGNLRIALFDNVSPKAKKWESNSTAAVNVAWLTINISSGTPNSLTNLASGTYWLCWQYDNVGSVPSYTAGSSGDGFYLAQTYGAFPSTISGETSSSEKWSEYVTYTVTITYYKTLAAMESGSPSITKISTRYKILTVTEVAVRTLSRIVTHYRTVTVTEVSVETLSKVSTHYRVLSATMAGVRTLSKVPTHIKTLAATIAASLILSKVATHFRQLAATETSAPNIQRIKTKLKSLVATEVSIASLAGVRFFTRTLTAVATSVSSLSRQLTRGVILNATLTASLTFSRKLNLTKTLSVVESSLPSLKKTLSKTLSVVASPVTSLTKAKMYLMILAASATASTSIIKRISKSLTVKVTTLARLARKYGAPVVERTVFVSRETRTNMIGEDSRTHAISEEKRAITA